MHFHKPTSKRPIWHRTKTAFCAKYDCVGVVEPGLDVSNGAKAVVEAGAIVVVQA